MSGELPSAAECHLQLTGRVGDYPVQNCTLAAGIYRKLGELLKYRYWFRLPLAHTSA